MSLLLHQLGRWQRKSARLERKAEGRPRKRLQKAPRRTDSRTSTYYCRNAHDVIRPPSCLTLVEHHIHSAPIARTKEAIRNQDVRPLERKPLACLDNSNGSYSPPEIEEKIAPKRRAKTPVLFIGQLENNLYLTHDPDLSRALAEQYYSLLPERHWTPCPDMIVMEANPKKSLRKIKPQQNLRSLASDCAKPSYCSDAETLVGSEVTPEKGARLDKKKYSLPQNDDDDGWREQPKVSGNEQSLDCNADALSGNPRGDADTTRQICLDLLTDELARALSRHHPNEASRLQISLMIETYESLQHGLGQENSGDQTKSLEGVVDNWLEALRAVNELSREGT